MCPYLAKTTPLLQGLFDKKSFSLWREEAFLACNKKAIDHGYDFRSVQVFFLDFDFSFIFWARRIFKAKKLYPHLLAAEIGNKWHIWLQSLVPGRKILSWAHASSSEHYYSLVSENLLWTLSLSDMPLNMLPWKLQVTQGGQGNGHWSTLHYLQSTSVLSSIGRVVMSSQAGKWLSSVCQTTIQGSNKIKGQVIDGIWLPNSKIC